MDGGLGGREVLEGALGFEEGCGMEFLEEPLGLEAWFLEAWSLYEGHILKCSLGFIVSLSWQGCWYSSKRM